jgi:hypothetical protein
MRRIDGAKAMLAAAEAEAMKNKWTVAIAVAGVVRC